MIVSKKLSWWVEFKTIHCYHLKSHLISTHSMAVKDSNFLIFFSCHVIQTLICFHVSYLGVRKSTSQKAVIFKKELGLYQTTLTPVLSAIYLQVICKNCKVYEWYYSERMLTMTQIPRQMIKLLCYSHTSFPSIGIFPPWDPFFSEAQLQCNGLNSTSSPKLLKVSKHSSRHSELNFIWSHRRRGSISSVLEIQD